MRRLLEGKKYKKGDHLHAERVVSVQHVNTQITILVIAVAQLIIMLGGVKEVLLSLRIRQTKGGHHLGIGSGG